uniref:Uncharacterized protein n=1 Tax=Alexandrium monilatum TaxID=311494 RepID=A0A7S4Q786_9DINO
MRREGMLACFKGCLPCGPQAPRGVKGCLPCGREALPCGGARVRSPPILPGLRGRVHEPQEAASRKVFSAPSPVTSPTLLPSHHRPHAMDGAAPKLLGHLEGSAGTKAPLSEVGSWRGRSPDGSLADAEAQAFREAEEANADVTSPTGMRLEELSPASRVVESSLPPHPSLDVSAIPRDSFEARSPSGNSLGAPYRAKLPSQVGDWSPASRASRRSRRGELRPAAGQLSAAPTPHSQAVDASPSGRMSRVASSPNRFIEASTPASRANRRRVELGEGVLDSSPSGCQSRTASPGRFFAQASSPASRASRASRRRMEAGSPSSYGGEMSRWQLGQATPGASPESQGPRRPPEQRRQVTRGMSFDSIASAARRAAGGRQTPRATSPLSAHTFRAQTCTAIACEATMMIGERTWQATSIVGEWALEASAIAGQRALQASAVAGQRALQALSSSSQEASRAAAQALASGARRMDSALNSYLDDLRVSLERRAAGGAAEDAEDTDSDASSGDRTPAPLGATALRAVPPLQPAGPATFPPQGLDPAAGLPSVGYPELQPSSLRAVSGALPSSGSHHLEREAALAAFGRSASFSQRSGPQVVQGAPQPLAPHRVQSASLHASAQGLGRPTSRPGPPLRGSSFGSLGQPQILPTSASFDHHSRHLGLPLHGQPASVLTSRHTFGASEQPGLTSRTSFGQVVRPGLAAPLARQ